MTRDEIDILWSRALHEAMQQGEQFTRYRFASLVAAAERDRIADEARHIVKRAEARGAAAERERIAKEFDRRAVYADGSPSSGWYEPHEPAEIVRGMRESA